MRLAYLLLCLPLLLNSCAGARPAAGQRLEPMPPAPFALADSTARPPDSLASLPQPRRGLFRRKQQPAQTQRATTTLPVASHAAVPRKCKSCTFNIVAGDQQVVGKKATAAAAGATALGTTTGQAQVGDGNAATMPADHKQGLLAKLKHLLGSAFDLVAGVCVLLLMLLVLFRKRFGFPF